MRILLDMGHTLSGADTGAIGFGRKEQDCTREIGYKLKSILEKSGHSVVVVSIDNASTLGQSLSYRVNKANNTGGDIYISIHLNAFNGNAYGTEVYTYGSKEFTEAKNVLANITALGYNNRGIKDGSGLYVIRNTNMKSMLIECCFIDSYIDMKKYNADNFAEAIAKGIVGNIVGQGSSGNSTNNTSQGSDDNVRAIQMLCNALGIRDQYGAPLSVDEIKGPKTIYAVQRLPLLGIPYVQREATIYVQRFLNISVDGIFGPNTEKYVKIWQGKKGLYQDGIVGPKTWLSFIA